jgi:hypothetical protein
MSLWDRIGVPLLRDCPLSCHFRPSTKQILK